MSDRYRQPRPRSPAALVGPPPAPAPPTSSPPALPAAPPREPPKTAEEAVAQCLQLGEQYALRPPPTLESLPAVFENLIRQLVVSQQQVAVLERAIVRQAVKDAAS